MLDLLRELWVMRGYKRVKVVEKAKRAEAFNVTTLIQPLTPEQVFQWVCRNIKFQRENRDYWQTPIETIRRGVGDCEDGAILLASLFNSVLPRSERWRVFVVIFEEPAHAVVVYRDKVYDWTQKRVFPLAECKNWKLWYMFNFRHAYTTKENVKKWQKQ